MDDVKDFGGETWEIHERFNPHDLHIIDIREKQLKEHIKFWAKWMLYGAVGMLLCLVI